MGGLNFAGGFSANLIGQKLTGTSNLCLNWVAALVSGATGALGGGINKALVGAAAQMAAPPLGHLASGSLQTVGGAINAIGEAVANVVQQRRR
jgi:hypothetical protein